MISVIDFALGKILDELYDKLINKIKKSCKEESDKLIKSLDAIEEKIDRQLVAPLKSGLILLSLSKYDDAIIEFVRATSLDKHSPMAKLWLGIGLSKIGKKDKSISYLKQAFLMNPILFNMFFDISFEFRIEDVLTSNKLLNLWEVRLPNEDILQSMPLSKFKKIKRFLKSPWFKKRSSAGIISISTSGIHPTFLWRLGSDLLYEYEEILSVLNIESGDSMWNINAFNRTLCFSTPNYVVIKINGDTPKFEVRYIHNGRLANQMSEYCFYNTFLPIGTESISKNIFKYSNCNMIKPEDAYLKTKVPREPGFHSFIKEMKTGFTCDFKPFIDQEILHFPFLKELYCLTMKNSWRHISFKDPQVGVISGLGCEAIIKRIKRSQKC